MRLLLPLLLLRFPLLPLLRSRRSLRRQNDPPTSKSTTIYRRYRRRNSTSDASIRPYRVTNDDVSWNGWKNLVVSNVDCGRNASVPHWPPPLPTPLLRKGRWNTNSLTSQRRSCARDPTRRAEWEKDGVLCRSRRTCPPPSSNDAGRARGVPGGTRRPGKASPHRRRRIWTKRTTRFLLLPLRRRRVRCLRRNFRRRRSICCLRPFCLALLPPPLRRTKGTSILAGRRRSCGS